MAAESLLRTFVYDRGHASASDKTIHIHEAAVPRVAGTVRVYATVVALPGNPVAGVAGQLQGAQQILVGQQIDGQFVPAIRFGVADSGRGPAKDMALLSVWAAVGNVDHFGDFVRPGTPCDFKVTIDLKNRSATVWTSRRGDDRWFLLVDTAAIDSKINAIDRLRVEQYPGAPGFSDVTVRETLWAEGESIRLHPLAKPNPAVAANRGFRFQSMRSTWRTHPGRHVTIARNPPVWFGFPEVVRVGQRTLIVTHNDGHQHGGGGGLFVRRSEDLGRTWQSPVVLPLTGVNCPRLQVLRDGSLLLLADVHGAVGLTPLFRSENRGRSWRKIGELDAAKAGGHAAIVPSRVQELARGAWLVVGSWYPGGKPWEGTEGEQLEFFRSTDRGANWVFHSALQAFPQHRHSLSEASLLTLKDGRLVLFAREGRGDGFPGIKAYSRDEGKTWEVQELPFAITGRTHAGFLPDGRVMLTFRSGIGRQALWAWIGDPLEAPRPSAAAGVHFNDARSVGLRDGALHLDNDGRRGQFTQYFFRPPGQPYAALDIICEARVVENLGRAATISIPYAGLLRVFPERVELETTAGVKHPPVTVSAGDFHTYRIAVRDGRLRLWTDGQERLSADRLDTTATVQAWTPSRASVHGLAFGNERLKNWGNHGRAVVHPDLWEPNITPEVTGYSIWRRFEAAISESDQPPRRIAWNAPTDGFPDQYQLDHIVEVEASVAGHDQGYSGWTQLPDGRLFVVNYTDDTAPLVQPRTGGINARMGISWIRGTYVSPTELPANQSIPSSVKE